MITVRWPDGNINSADDWSALVEGIRADQWEDVDPIMFRNMMAHRAIHWSGTHIQVGGTDEEFVRELQRAGMLEVMVTREE